MSLNSLIKARLTLDLNGNLKCFRTLTQWVLCHQNTRSVILLFFPLSFFLLLFLAQSHAPLILSVQWHQRAELRAARLDKTWVSVGCTHTIQLHSVVRVRTHTALHCNRLISWIIKLYPLWIFFLLLLYFFKPQFYLELRRGTR